MQAVGPACFPFHLTLQEHWTWRDICEIISTLVEFHTFNEFSLGLFTHLSQEKEYSSCINIRAKNSIFRVWNVAIYAFFGVNFKFWIMCLCKRFDKYHVFKFKTGWTFWWSARSNVFSCRWLCRNLWRCDEHFDEEFLQNILCIGQNVYA